MIVCTWYARFYLFILIWDQFELGELFILACFHHESCLILQSILKSSPNHPPLKFSYVIKLIDHEKYV
jgi:hypothetical protein